MRLGAAHKGGELGVRAVGGRGKLRRACCAHAMCTQARARLVEAHTLLHLRAQADMLCHGREAYVKHLEPLEALERLDLVVV